ncbi:hypothetical protein R1A27_28635 [Methylobacterium sp. NMS12]|uniref:hypothetical protein n=1 Tax=Methylobacterium sp. NMS12 TaxID=3079766 RepID=UPI003F881AB1
MSNLTIPVISAAVFVAVGWLIIHSRREYEDATRHTLTIFALVIGMLVLIGVTAKLHAAFGVHPMMRRIEARSQVDAVVSAQRRNN